MIALVLFKTSGGIARYSLPPNAVPFLGVTAMMQMVMGFFATAGAAGVDFGMNSRDARDVKWGGLVGIALAAVYAGGCPLLSVAGARGINPGSTITTYGDVIALTGGLLASAMFFLFAIASVVPACVSSFIASNSFSTMVPRLPRVATALAGAAVSILLAITGLAGNLVSVFLIVGASFGPICGAMTADYLVSGKRWAGPRRGINYAGYIAWALGFAVGIIPFLPLGQGLKNYTQPQVLYSWITGFLVYAVLSKAGMQPETLSLATVDVRETPEMTLQ
jgi:cytosine permease